jgi:hypothetical protein
MNRPEITDRLHNVAGLKRVERDYESEVVDKLSMLMQDLKRERLLPIRQSEINSLLHELQEDLQKLEQLLYRFLFESLVLYFQNLRKADCSKKHIETALKVLSFLSDKFDQEIVASNEDLNATGVLMSYDFWDDVLVRLIDESAKFGFESLIGVMTGNDICAQLTAGKIRVIELGHESRVIEEEIKRIQGVTQDLTLFLAEHYGGNNLKK